MGWLVLINSIATARYAAFKQLDADEFPFEALLFDLEQGSASDEIPLSNLIVQPSLASSGLICSLAHGRKDTCWPPVAGYRARPGPRAAARVVRRPPAGRPETDDIPGSAI